MTTDAPQANPGAAMDNVFKWLIINGSFLGRFSSGHPCEVAPVARVVFEFLRTDRPKSL